MYLFYFFAAVLVFLGYKSLRGGIDYLRFFRSELAAPVSGFSPPASVIAPCRGLDQDLRENLAALFRQNYPRYEIIFVVDEVGDEAAEVIGELIGKQNEREAERRPGKGFLKTPDIFPSVAARLVVAGKARGEGQKVHNLRRAVGEVRSDSEVLVFVDSDARPGPDWLRSLVAPLEDGETGCATGYRWFVPERGGFASHLRAVWNASIASALGSNERKNFCWGGSTAIRTDLFAELEMAEKWRGTLSDDFALTRALHSAGRPIRFVPGCLTASVEDCTFGELLEFTNRQMKITRVYAPHLWKASLIGSLIFTGTFWAGVALLFFISGPAFWITGALLLIVLALGVGKAHLRLKAVKMILRDHQKELNRSFPWQISLWVLTPALYFFNCFSALLSNEILWRGIRYKLESPEETVVMNDDPVKN
ncbi:MAG: glycosyltransferase [Pyrinomonadaceae bacterium]